MFFFQSIMKLASPVFFLALVLVQCEPPAAYGPPSGGGHANNGHTGYEEPQSYEFGYRVKDDYSGSSFHQKEASDGSQVRGEYRVALPDGRTQIVMYWADWQTGFHANVKYEGQATYPPQAKSSNGGSKGYNYPSPPSGQYGAPQ